MAEAHGHWLDVRDKPGLLHRLMVEFVGGHISLEGDLAKCKFDDDLVVAREEVPLLKRNTLYPTQDFVVLQLAPATITPVFSRDKCPECGEAVLKAAETKP